MNTVGIGYDVHRLAEGRPLILGGVHFDYPLGLEGHSDADVLSHAIADALLGAAGEPDIGSLFPNTDEKIKGINSLDILQAVRERLEKRGLKIVNIDSTLVAESPKIAPRIKEMKQVLGRILNLSPERVGIKATTHELLGAFGRGEGMGAMAVALIEHPSQNM